jgi:methionyl-tRNA formyltransferase
MRLAFAGTPEFARVALAALHAAGFDIALVLTQPDRPAGRGMKLQASAVKEWAIAHGVPVQQPRSLRLDGAFADEARQARQARVVGEELRARARVERRRGRGE